MFVFILKMSLEFIVLFTVLWVFFDTIYQYCLIPHYRRKIKRLKPSSFFWHIYHTLPYLLAEWIEEKKSAEFKEHGFMLFSGKQGSGKTMAMTYYINRLILKYPDVKVATNYGLMCQDFELYDYHQLFTNCGVTGVIYGFDEIQATFSNRAWKDNFDPSFISAISQNRKSHRLIYGTCQNIQLVDKAIRIQAMKYAKCMTIPPGITIVAWFIPEYDFEGNLEKSKFCGLRLFFQDRSLRYQYDTYDLIKSIK